MKPLCQWSRLAAMAVYACAVLHVTTPAHSREPAAALFAAPTTAIPRASTALPGVVTSQSVSVDGSVLNQLEAKSTDRVEVALFGRRRTAVFTYREEFGPGRFVVIGAFEGDSLSRVSLSVYDGVVTFDAQGFGENSVRLSLAGDGGYWLEEMKPESQHSCATCAQVPARSKTASAKASTPGMDALGASVPAAAAADGNQWIDVLGLYTNAARDAAGGEAAIRSIYQSRVATCNMAHADSGTGVRFRLMNVQHCPDYWENSPTFDLTNFGVVNSLARDLQNSPMRLNVGADLIHVLVNHPQNDGQNGSASPDDFASSTRWDAPDLSFAHEIGHCLGCLHPVFADPSGTYNHGYLAEYKWSDNVISYTGSIMSYGPNRIARFSDPTYFAPVTRAGWGTQLVPLGDATAWNALYIRVNYPTTLNLQKPTFFIRSGAGLGEATVLSPSGSMADILASWIPNTGATAGSTMAFDAGSHTVPARIDTVTRLQKWDAGLGSTAGNARLAP